MGIEIERKFLVKGDAWRVGKPSVFRQAYLNLDKNRTVRLRIADETAFLTIKGKTLGFSRAEFEYEIPLSDAVEMFDLCEKPHIEKRRWKVAQGDLTWEVDEFFGENEGLIVAEIELGFEEQVFDKPDWVSDEVTSDHRYSNSSLISKPFKSW